MYKYTNGAPASSADRDRIGRSPKLQLQSTACTPPPKRFHRVRNPFEMADRLHLPLIASPSLFHPRTPKLSSTQFEWDIEEVSMLKPAHVEPHETQFHDSPDPERESRAQMAISAFFKESFLVPSPVDCPLRNQRIILSQIDGNTPLSNKSRKKRDTETQTDLTLPPVLPTDLEEILRPYFKPHLASATPSPKAAHTSSDILNRSMRRKLFDMRDVIVLGDRSSEQENYQTKTQIVWSSPQAKQTIFAGRLSSSDSSSSFGCLSPIRSLCGLPAGTPDDGNSSSSNRKRKQIYEPEMPSPIAISQPFNRGGHIPRPTQNHARNNYRDQRFNRSELDFLSDLGDLNEEGPSQACRNFTPDRSSSPKIMHECSTDRSINQRVSRLVVNSIEKNGSMENSLVEYLEGDTSEALQFQVKDVGKNDECYEDERDPETDEDDLLQTSQFSTISFNGSSSNSDTPRGHRRRSANRKNLSQSFGQLEPLAEVFTSPGDSKMPVIEPSQLDHLPFYRTDSGFNEINSTTSTLGLF